MNSFLIRGLFYQQLNSPLLSSNSSISDTLAHFSGKVGGQARQLLDLVPDAPPESISGHYLCSTIVNTCFTVGDINVSNFNNSVAEIISHPIPVAFVNAYECASWGYAIRYHLQKHPDTRFVLISVIDANVYNFEFWIYNENWEHSGFGITTLLIERVSENKDRLITGFASGHNPMMAFAIAIRKAAVNYPGNTITLPLFPQRIREMLASVLNKSHILPNDHEQWGHCFGSDPWLSILNNTELDSSGKPLNNSYLACSLALNGYYSILEAVVNPDTILMLDRNWSDQARYGPGD
ncbi:hypothetical protein HNR65_002209 [Desulfosalsimonas propionicica]|uniref:Uncharacterized protein n=1 Tax=Desulfosalsimonas propionicica TaxID=332175 RepID=A0A7W0C9Y5_9BACT|nr:hypothetical protein [Desulfosalsimonas propionicica]MBA2881878.1 hypothetical protein [Desulfosalsimonas propionicica]